jgi:hypothetical protein
VILRHMMTREIHELPGVYNRRRLVEYIRLIGWEKQTSTGESVIFLGKVGPYRSFPDEWVQYEKLKIDGTIAEPHRLGFDWAIPQREPLQLVKSVRSRMDTLPFQGSGGLASQIMSNRWPKEVILDYLEAYARHLPIANQTVPLTVEGGWTERRHVYEGGSLLPMWEGEGAMPPSIFIPWRGNAPCVEPVPATFGANWTKYLENWLVMIRRREPDLRDPRVLGMYSLVHTILIAKRHVPPHWKDVPRPFDINKDIPDQGWSLYKACVCTGPGAVRMFNWGCQMGFLQGVDPAICNGGANASLADIFDYSTMLSKFRALTSRQGQADSPEGARRPHNVGDEEDNRAPKRRRIDVAGGSGRSQDN